MDATNGRRRLLPLLAVCALAAALTCRGEDTQLLRAKMQLLVDQAKELCDEADRPGSVTHDAAHRYFYGLAYGAGTNLLARADSASTTQLMHRYMDLVDRNYESYVKVETATAKAAATGTARGKSGGRSRASRLASAERMGEKELAAAVKQWEDFVRQLKARKGR